MKQRRLESGEDRRGPLDESRSAIWASLTMRGVRISVNKRTKYRLGKDPLIVLCRSSARTHAVAAVNFEENVKGDTIYLATEIRITSPKKSDSGAPSGCYSNRAVSTVG